MEITRSITCVDNNSLHYRVTGKSFYCEVINCISGDLLSGDLLKLINKTLSDTSCSDFGFWLVD